jgi:glycosyltransferase involved in cell wall biosynthesis
VLEGGPELQKLEFGSKAHVHEYIGRREPYILFLSQWRPHKGIGTILDAFEQFKRETNLPHTLVLVGKQDGAASSTMRHIARLEHRHDVITPGFAPDALLPALYKYASLFVMPSEYEGFGLPVLEALAQQTPCLIANASSLPEVGGAAAHYAPARDSAAWAQQLNRLLTNDSLREAPLVHAERQVKHFSWAVMAQRTAAAYETALAR